MMIRRNPSLVILSGLPNPERIPAERAARAGWARFHLRDGRKARVLQIPDAPGVPKTVVVLGALEGLEWVASRTPRGARTINIRRDNDRGPWLVMEPSRGNAKRLWMVARDAKDLARVPTRGYVKAIYYFPPKTSSKHAGVGYRHAAGDSGGNEKDGVPSKYPRLSGRGRVRALVDGAYRVEPRGIVA